jgi:N-acetyl sugar amidotransferase
VNSDYKICTVTVMDTSDPDIRFDINGVSNHVYEFENNVRPNWMVHKRGAEILERTLRNIKKQREGKEYDCLIGLSGGLDSSYMLHRLVVDYGMRPLVFDVDGGWNSELAVHNITKLVEKLELDLFTEVIDWEEMREFQLALFRAGVPHLDIPQDMAFIATLYKFAERYKIPYIFNGGNISTECVLMPLSINYFGTDLVHVRDILKKHSNYAFSKYPFIDIFYHKLYLRYVKQIKVLKPLNFIPFNKLGAVATLTKEYGWKPYVQKHFESRFTQFYEGYWLPSRFGYDMRRNQLSSLILTDQMNRSDALKILETPPLSTEFVELEKSFISNKLNIEVSELSDYHNLPLKYFWDFRNRKTLFNLGERILRFLNITRRGGSY